MKRGRNDEKKGEAGEVTLIEYDGGAAGRSKRWKRDERGRRRAHPAEGRQGGGQQDVEQAGWTRRGLATRAGCVENGAIQKRETRHHTESEMDNVYKMCDAPTLWRWIYMNVTGSHMRQEGTRGDGEGWR